MIHEVFTKIKAVLPDLERISETQSFPHYADGTAFQYWAYNEDQAFVSYVGWDDLIEKIQKEVASAYL